MSIRTWQVEDRPRERLLNKGSEALSDAELLALFLGTGLQGSNAVELSRQLIKQAGSLRQLLDMPAQELKKLPGLGVARVALLKGALELAQRYLVAELKRNEGLSCATDAGNFLVAKLRGYSYEVFSAIFLDQRHRVITYEELFKGTLNAAAVYPREVVVRSLLHGAAAVIFAHNHPSGMAEPSPADVEVTERLREALHLVEVRVLDHFIIGDGGWVSMAERGWR